MVNGLYTAAASMINLQKKQDIASHNLSNMNTTGFKLSKLITKTEVTIKRNDEAKLHQDEEQSLNEVVRDFSGGALVQTDNDLDLALSDSGFFKIMTPDGVRYTRNGAFSLNSLGELVTLNGHPVLQDNDDTVHLENNEKLTVASDGGLFVQGAKIGQIGVVNFETNKPLLSEGKGYYNNTDPVNNPARVTHEASLKQGYLEGSNVDVIRTMVEMISQFRNYEASQKTMHAIDETVQKAVNEIGRVS